MATQTGFMFYKSILKPKLELLRSLTRFHVVKVIGPIDCCSIQNRNPRPPPNSGIFDGRGSLLGKRKINLLKLDKNNVILFSLITM
jgi:hypothetical protein